MATPLPTDDLVTKQMYDAATKGLAAALRLRNKLAWAEGIGFPQPEYAEGADEHQPRLESVISQYGQEQARRGAK